MNIEANWGVNRNGYLEIVWRFHPGTLEYIEGVGETLSYRAGSRIIAQGEEAQAMYLIMEGTVRVVRNTPDGERILALLDPVRSFGEVAMLTNSTRVASVDAETDVRVLKITRDNLLKLSIENPLVALHIYRVLAESLARAVKETGVIPAELSDK
ncbi:MAG: hypothetical protein C5B54_12100 [Acidobacteria bacterium]|nr:MAG: hypothetical protein C5B54_12100 [Acidobacteriota bacterium]